MPNFTCIIDPCSFRGNHGSIVPFGPRPVRERRAALDRRCTERGKRSNHGSIVPFGHRPVCAQRAALERRGKDRSRRNGGVRGGCYAQYDVHYRWQVSWVATNARCGATMAGLSLAALGLCLRRGQHLSEVAKLGHDQW